MSSLPRFQFKVLDLKDEDIKAFDDALAGGGKKESKFFRAGKHEVSIISSEYVGEASDPTWGQYKITYEGAGGKQIKEWISIPFQSLTEYKAKSGKNTTYPGQKLKGFLEAMGVTVTLKTLGDTMKVYFAKNDLLVGMKLSIEVGFNGPHSDYLGRDGAGEPSYGYMDSHGQRVEGVPTFDSYDAVEEYHVQHSPANIKFQKFPQILRHVASVTPNSPKNNAW